MGYRLYVLSKLFNKLRTTEDVVINAGIVIFVIATFVASLWNVDAYHEGALFPSAVGISDGLSIFREVNNQYGFIGPLLNSPWLAIFGPHLVVSRIFSFLVICIIAYMLYLNAQLFISQNAAKIAALLWIGISPVWSYVFTSKSLSGGTWPNHYAVLLILFMTFILFRQSYPPSSRSVFFAGSFCFLSSQARMEFIAVWVLCTLVILVTQKILRRAWILGSLSAALVTFLYLFLNNSLRDWFEQTYLVWTMSAPDVPTIGLGFFISNGLNFIMLAFIGLFVCLLDNFLLKNHLKPALRVGLITIIFLFIASIEGVIPETITIAERNLSPYLSFAAYRSLFSYVNLAILISLWIIFSQLLSHSRKRTIKSEYILDFQNLILVACCLGIFGVFHNTNADYTSITIAPFILLIVKNRNEVNMRVFHQYLSTLKYVVIPSLLITSLFLFINQVPQHRFEYSTSTLRGLFAQTQADRDRLDSLFGVIEKYTTPRRTYMDCQTGLLTVGPKGYIGKDQWSWNQQPAQMLRGRFSNLESGESIIACHINAEDKALFESLTKSKKISSVFSNSDLVIYVVN